MFGMSGMLDAAVSFRNGACVRALNQRPDEATKSGLTSAAPEAPRVHRKAAELAKGLFCLWSNRER